MTNSPPLSSPPFLPLMHPFDVCIHRHPIFDAINTLRRMNVISDCITLPTIVVIGDESSGKSSVIESLTGFDLPRRTRLPLILKIQHSPQSDLGLEYKDESIHMHKSCVSSTIEKLTETLVGKEIQNLPLTLVVEDTDVTANITIVDLPGIPVHDHDSHKITDMVESYIKPEDCVILNVISATCDILKCESIKISKKYEERTVHVVTKVDMAAKDMVEIVTTNKGPDFVCVRNRIGNEGYQSARAKEANLFLSDRWLIKLDKSMTGVRVLSQKLFMMQLKVMSKLLCGIVGVIDEEINMCRAEQSRLQQHNYTTISEAMPVLIQIIKMSKKSLSKILISLEFDEFDEFQDQTDQLHCCSKLVEISNEFSQQLKHNQVEENEEFLAYEILLLEERKWSKEQVFHLLFQRKLANIAAITNAFVSRIWDYIESVIIRVLRFHANKLCPRLVILIPLIKAAQIVIARKKESFKGRMLEILEMMKKNGRYNTKDPRVVSSWNKLREKQRHILLTPGVDTFCNVQVSVKILQNYPDTILYEAFEIKTKLVACLEMMHKSSKQLDLPSLIHVMVENEMETLLVNELKIDTYSTMLKDPPSVTTKSWKLSNRIELLGKLKKVIQNEMDKVSFLCC